MRIVCSQCGETFDTYDVVIEGGRVECPKCKAAALLDDRIEHSSASDSASLKAAGEVISPAWLKESEVDGILLLRWKWNHGGGIKWLHLLVSVIATLFVAMIAIAGATRGGSLLPLAGFLLVALVGFGCTLVILTHLVNSTNIQFDGRELVIWHGPLFVAAKKRATRLPVEQISSLRFTRSGQPPRFEYRLACRTLDGGGWQLDCFVGDGIGARYIKRRLEDALGLNL